MRILIPLYAVVFIGVACAAPIPKKLRSKFNTDIDTLQGRWLQTARSFKGQAIVPAPASDDSYILFDGDTITVCHGNKKGFDRCTFVLDDTTTPKQLRVTMPGGGAYNFAYSLDDKVLLKLTDALYDKSIIPTAVEPSVDTFYVEYRKQSK